MSAREFMSAIMTGSFHGRLWKIGRVARDAKIVRSRIAAGIKGLPPFRFIVRAHQPTQDEHARLST